MDLAGEDFAKAVGEALRDIRDMEDAQRIIREVAEEKLPRPEQQRTAWQRENAEKAQRAFARATGGLDRPSTATSDGDAQGVPRSVQTEPTAGPSHG